jgi:hypothetical protein
LPTLYSATGPQGDVILCYYLFLYRQITQLARNSLLFAATGCRDIPVAFRFAISQQRQVGIEGN